MSWRQLAKLPIHRDRPVTIKATQCATKADPSDTKGPLISTADFNPLDPAHVAELKKWCSYALHKSKLSSINYVQVDNWQGYTLNHVHRPLKTIQTYRFSKFDLAVDLTFHSKPDWDTMRSRIMDARTDPEDVESTQNATWISDYKTIIVNSILTTIAFGPPYRHVIFMELTADMIQDIVTSITPTCTATSTHVICRYMPLGVAFIITGTTRLRYTSMDAVKLYEDIALFRRSNATYTLSDMYAIARQVLHHVCSAGIRFGTRDNRVMLDSTFEPIDVKYLMTVLRKKLRYHPANVFCQRVCDGYLIIIIFTYGLPNAFDPLNFISTYQFDRGHRDASPLMPMLHVTAKFRPFD